MISSRTRILVRRRAGDRCEYCLLAQTYSRVSHHVEHILAKQHGGSDDIENLALACNECNRSKGPNISGIDPQTGAVVQLFHPRLDRWAEHFVFQGPRIAGLTAVGRATVLVLGMNSHPRLQKRAELPIEER